MLLTSAIFQFLPLNFQSSNEAYFRKVWEKPLFQNVSSKICCKKFFSNVAFYNLIFHEVLLQKKSRDLFLLKFVRCNLTNFFMTSWKYSISFLQNLFGTSFEKSLSPFGISAFKYGFRESKSFVFAKWIVSANSSY